MKPGASPLSRLLADARRDHATLGKPQPNLTPADADAAYAIQHEILAIGGARIGGWKIGASRQRARSRVRPRRASTCIPAAPRCRARRFAPLGLELEIAFRFGRRFEPSATRL